jgi:hypothetical protein
VIKKIPKTGHPAEEGRVYNKSDGCACRGPFDLTHFLFGKLFIHYSPILFSEKRMLSYFL